jgi:small-conductance mechanosensitive channel
VIPRHFISRLPLLAFAVFGLALAAPAQESGESTMAAWEREAKLELTKANDPAAEQLLPEGVRPTALAMRRRDLEQTLLAIGRQKKAAAGAPEHQRALAQAEEALKAWTRFEEPPPYPILKLDNLHNLRDAQTGKKVSLESSIDIMERAMANLLTEEQEVGENLRRRNTEADRGDADAIWFAESARIQSRQIQARKTALQTTIDNLRLQLKTANAELALLERQITTAEKQVAYSDEDAKAIAEASQQRQKTLREELVPLHKRLRAADEARERAAEARDKALAAEAGTVTPETLALVQARAQAAETTMEALQLMVESVEWLLQIESYHLAAQEDRRTLMTKGTPRAERTAAVDAIRVIIDRLKAWEIVTTNETNTVAADLANVETRLAALPEGDARLPILQEERSVLIERQTAVQRAARAVSSQGRLLNRWITQYETRHRPFREKLGDYWNHFTGYFRTLLSIEIFHYQKGEGEEGKRAVSLGMLLFALLLFLVPYFIARLILRRIQRATVAMHLVNEAQARTLGNWLGLLIAVPVALFALNFLGIPLTVFAFLGGALVIALGFGMQTILKNFISGIIVLFERRVRVGDIVEVEGCSGLVTEINTRSSIIRSPDGIETLVPNSLFLENRVTNLTLSDRRSRRLLRVGAAYGTSPSKVIDALRECVDRHGLVLKDPEPLILFEDFGDSSLVFAVYFWVEFNDRTNPLVVASDLRIMIEKRFAELDIHIPFPQRDFHFSNSEPLAVRLAHEEPEDPATPPA